jgi:hypothetical protein
MKSNSWRRCEMKKWATLLLCIIMVFGMAACNNSVDVSETSSLETNGTVSSETPEAEKAISTASPFPGLNGDALSAQTQLVLGTFKLEGTDLAVDSEQAAVLLPLWKAYSSLLQSDTAAEAEVDAVFEQIQSNMTQDQMEFIAALGMTQGDVTALVEELGLQIENPRPDDDTGDGPEGRPFAGQEGAQLGSGPGDGSDGSSFGGQSPEGTPPGEMSDGQGSRPDQNPEEMATLQAGRGDAGGRGGDRMTLLLIDTLIELLESKTA